MEELNLLREEVRDIRRNSAKNILGLIDLGFEVIKNNEQKVELVLQTETALFEYDLFYYYGRVETLTVEVKEKGMINLTVDEAVGNVKNFLSIIK